MARAVAVAAMPLLVALLAAASCGRAAALDFYVGGPDGWTVKPAEPFGRWAERNRFQVNDRLVFRYSAKDDAVLVVTQSSYDACNTTNPDQRLADGNSVYVLTSSGPHFFISCDAGRCRAGERLVVVVLAVRNYTPAVPSASSPPPASRNTSSAPPAKSPPHAPAPAPRAPPSPPAARNASAPSSPSPAPSPAPAPGTNGTSSEPSHSSASALRAGVLACLVIAGAAILV